MNEIELLKMQVTKLEKQNSRLKSRLDRVRQREKQDVIARMIDFKSLSTLLVFIIILAINTLFIGLGLASPFQGVPAIFLGGIVILIIVSFWILVTIRANRNLAVRAKLKHDLIEVSADAKEGAKPAPTKTQTDRRA